jgi:serine/threonine protein kinase
MLGRWQVGDRIADRFDVFEVHQGGMGVVYLVQDRGITAPGHETVALKTLHDEFLPDRVRIARFAEECRLWIGLGHHPHIVQAFAVEEIGGKPHLLLERVTGGELRSRIGSQPVAPRQALRYGVEFCLGMEHAVRQGLRCHRDIKPGNLLIDATGSLKITDFGLAGIRDEFLVPSLDLDDVPIPLAESPGPQEIVWTDPRDGQGPIRLPYAGQDAASAPKSVEPFRPPGLDDPRVGPSRLADGDSTLADLGPSETLDYTPSSHLDPCGAARSRLTRTGAMLGTLPYMAPEQFRDAKSADVRADIYSFGVVLFQMLTAELPFKGETPAKFERQHAQYDPPSVVPAISRVCGREAGRVDAIVRRCLAKDPAGRYPTVVALRRALLAVLRRLGRGFGRAV